MSTIFCNACKTHNYSNSTKCEQCKTRLSQENINIDHDEWENDFIYIENAEAKGKIFKLENLDEIHKAELGIETTTNDQLVQAIKQEPEFQIEPDYLEEGEKAKLKNEKESYQCSECNKCFRRKASLVFHKNTKHYTDSSDSEEPKPKLKEPVLKSKIFSQSEDKSTGSTFPTSILKCDSCNDSFANSNDLNVHRSHCLKKRKFYCEVCNIFVCRKSSLRKHNKTQQHNYNLANPNTQARSKYMCSFCGENFKRKASLLAHTNAVHCTSSSDTESSDKIPQQPPIKLNKHSKYLEERNKILQTTPQSAILKCDLCNNSFANSNDLNAHRSICATKEKFSCDPCEIFLGSKAALLKHKKSRFHNYNLGNPPAEDKLKYVCIFCGERFALQILLTNHKKAHTEESKLLSETSRIQRVDGRLMYICTICNKSTTNKSGHTVHLRVHTKEKPVKCDLCESTFTTRSSLVRHMMLHTDERPYKCNICDATYRHKRNLKKHLFMHTGQRPYKCKYCDKTFALKFTFNDHERRHTGETPYQCEKCKESFNTSNMLNFHRRKEHNIDTNTKSKVKILKNIVKSVENIEEN